MPQFGREGGAERERVAARRAKATPILAELAESLVVFQRSPNYTIPFANGTLTVDPIIPPARVRALSPIRVNVSRDGRRARADL